MQNKRITHLVEHKSSTEGLKKTKIYNDLAGLLGKSMRRVQECIRFQDDLLSEQDMQKILIYFSEASEEVEDLITPLPEGGK